MPVETGHTLYLPGSQSCLPGYFAHTRPEFQEYFDQHHVQLPLAKGGTMEQVDRARMCRALHPTLRTLSNPANAIAACAESYPFPTNLGRAPPTGGLAPQSQAQLLHQALKENWTPEAFAKALDTHSAKWLT